MRDERKSQSKNNTPAKNQPNRNVTLWYTDFMLAKSSCHGNRRKNSNGFTKI